MLFRIFTNIYNGGWFRIISKIAVRYRDIASVFLRQAIRWNFCNSTCADDCYIFGHNSKEAYLASHSFNVLVKTVDHFWSSKKSAAYQCCCCSFGDYLFMWLFLVSFSSIISPKYLTFFNISCSRFKTEALCSHFRL